ncbi:MAG: LamG domain-containing protein, partial [Planctomycetes bacterium]|nr:LamG domain-containing protein [Planctomycetota bacterium]
AQNDAGTRADAVIVANAATGGRLGIFYQTASQDDDPRGEVMSEWINNWYLAGNLDVVERAVLFTEDFEGLALGPNVDEALAGDAVWTDTPPEGWVVDESGIPGIGMDETDGVTEWAGWAFADKAWWTETAGDQDRSLFELGSGIVAVADPDEWDDGERMPIPIAVDPYDTWLTTPEIAISGSEVGTLQLKFDSSWRPEFDDNYHQTANITASFDGGEPVVVMLWESDEASDNYKPYATNETVIVNLDNPAGARRLVLTFGLFDAGNDWWWAIDNLEVSGIVQGLEPVDPGTDGLAAFYALAGDATDSSGNGIDGTIGNAETGGLGDGGSVWVDDPERGTVISFNGTAAGAYVRAGDIPQMTLTNDFTWAFWANHSDENTADNDIILGNRMDENTVDFVPRQFIKFTPTKFEWHMNGNGDDNMDYDDIPADVWLHHAVVKTGDQLTYYRNGVEGGSGTITQPLDFPQPLYFGGDNEGSDGENWSGLMSEVAIYDRALSVGEVRYLAGEREGDPSLVIYYDFDEVGDIVADQSGKGHDGVVNGDVTAEAEGKLGGAANFANGGFLDLDGPSIPAEDIPTSAMTLAAWIKIANTGGDHEIFSARASDESWLIHPEPKSSGDIRWLLRSYGGTTIFQIRAGTVTWDEWLHFAGTYDKESGKAALYINGELIEEMVVENPADIAGDWGLGARVGKTIDDGRPFTGLMDEFRMYTRALSQDEVLTIMQGM